MAAGDFATTAGNIGSGIGEFIGGITNPLFGGTTTQSTTNTPVKTQGSNTALIVGIFALVVILALVGYFIFRN